MTVIKMGAKFNKYMRVRFASFLYERTLRSTAIFSSVSSNFVHVIVTALDEVHFKKDADIIRANDVQGKLYVVYKGKVDVTVANVVLATLGPGGVFGCFAATGTTRQTIAVRALVHTTLLAIESEKFHEMVRDFEADRANCRMKDIA